MSEDDAAADLRRFWSALASGLEEGRPLLAALAEASDECDCPEACEAVAALSETVSRSALLSEAMAAQPGFFGPGAVHVIRGGEHPGLVARAARFISDAAGECPACAGWRGGSA